MILKVLIFVATSSLAFYNVAGEVTFFIVPTEDTPCPDQGVRYYSTGSEHYYEYRDIGERADQYENESMVCLTLEQYVRLNTNVTIRKIQHNQTLKFAAGEHRLDSVLDISKLTEFIMMSEGATMITCSNENATILLESIENVVMSGITFIGCEEVEISHVSQFTFENSKIQRSYLTLYHIANATLLNSTFLCTHAYCGGNHTIERLSPNPPLVIKRSSALIQQCVFTGLYGPGAIVYAFVSNITVDSSTFERNVVDPAQEDDKWFYFPGVIFVNGSDLHITDSIFFNNTADTGAPVSACNSTVSVDGNSTKLYRYVNTSSSQCVLYGTSEPVATTSEPPDSTPVGYTVLWIVAIFTPVVCIAVLILLCVFALGYLCRQRCRRSHYNRRSSLLEKENNSGTKNYNYVPLMNTT